MPERCEIPNLSSLEIDLTYRCGLDCWSCNRFTGIAPWKEEQDITLAQIATLCDDSYRLKWKWDRWFLIGGEPTLHPKLFEILEIIGEHLKRSSLKVILTTRDFGVTKKIQAARQRFAWLDVLHGFKTSGKQPKHISICLAPCDTGEQPEQYLGCKISSSCGVGLNYRGYYPCAVAGAIDRVFNLGLAIPKLEDVTVEALQSKFNAFCKLCGHYSPTPCQGRTILSQTWIDAIEKYKAP